MVLTGAPLLAELVRTGFWTEEALSSPPQPGNSMLHATASSARANHRVGNRPARAGEERGGWVLIMDVPLGLIEGGRMIRQCLASLFPAVRRGC
jgi:hypothetical protein